MSKNQSYQKDKNRFFHLTSVSSVKNNIFIIIKHKAINMELSAILNTGQRSIMKLGKSTQMKSVTPPCTILSIKFPNAPPRIRKKAMISSFDFVFNANKKQ